MATTSTKTAAPAPAIEADTAAQLRDASAAAQNQLRLAADYVQQAAAGRMSKEDFETAVDEAMTAAEAALGTIASILEPTDPVDLAVDTYARTTRDTSKK